MRIKSLFFLAAATGAATALPLDIPSFHADYNDKFDAVANGGTLAGTHSREVLTETLETLLKPGISGNAALVGTSEDKQEVLNIVYSNKGVMGRESGTVSFLVSPQTWRGDDDAFHIFFRAEGEGSEIIIYKYFNSPLLLFSTGPKALKDGKPQTTIVRADIKKWSPGEWYLVTAVWDREKAALYVNDSKQGEEAIVAAPASEFARFGAGGLYPARWKTPLGFTLIDDLRIFQKALTGPEVKKLADSYGDALRKSPTGKTPPPANALTLVDEKENVINLSFKCQSFDSGENSGRARVAVRRCDDKKEVWSSEIESKVLCAVKIPLTAMRPGEHVIEMAVLKKDGSEASKTVQDFLMPSRPEPWENNKIGESDNVPPPWTPMKWDKQAKTAECQGRQYVFGESLLPEQILSGGSKLLKAPVRLVVDSAPLDGKAEVEFVARTDRRILLKTKMSAGALRIKSTADIEFDGFCWFDMLIEPDGEAGVRSMTLDIPFLPESSTLFNSMTKFYSNFKPGHCGTIRDFSMDLYNNPRIIFVGNDEAGLEWFCEDLAGWRNKSQENTLRIICGPDSNILRLGIIDHQTVLSAPMRLRFGLQALPVRPLPEGWRLRKAYGKDVNPSSLDKNFFDPWFVWGSRHNYPNPAFKRDEYDRLLKEKSSTSPKVLHYFAGFTNSPMTPEWPYWCAKWSKIPPEPGTYGSMDKPMHAFAWNCPADRSYRDFYLHRLGGTIDALGVKNLYFDNQDAQMCKNHLHGCGWKGSDGKTYETYNLLATRDLTKRIYQLLKEKSPDGIIMRHMSAKLVMPTLAFCDVLADGELYNLDLAKTENYQGIFEPGMFRASFRAMPYGLPNYFIPQFLRAVMLYNKSRLPEWEGGRKAYEKHRAKTRHFVGYFIVHDAMIWPLFGVTLDDWWKIQKDFGMDGRERFFLYNDPSRPLRVESRSAMVSCYALDGKLLVIAMNDSDSAEQVRVTPLEQVVDASDAESGAHLKLEDGAFYMDVPPRDYRIVKTTPKNK